MKENKYEIVNKSLTEPYDGYFKETEDIQDMQQEIIKSAIKCEEEVIIQVLRQVLNREPVIDDFKKCKMGFFEHSPDRYTLSFNGVILGEVVREFGGTFKVTFNPI